MLAFVTKPVVWSSNGASVVANVAGVGFVAGGIARPASGSWIGVVASKECSARFFPAPIALRSVSALRISKFPW